MEPRFGPHIVVGFGLEFGFACGYEDRIELIPVADDPLAAVREAAGELHDASVEEFREAIEAEAKDEAEGAGGDR